MKCARTSALSFGEPTFRISCTVQKLVWLKRFVNATILGAVMYLSFFIQAQLVNSSGWIWAKQGKSNIVIWCAKSSGDTLSAFMMTGSRFCMDEFGGKLWDLFSVVPFSLKLWKNNYISWWFIEEIQRNVLILIIIGCTIISWYNIDRSNWCNWVFFLSWFWWCWWWSYIIFITPFFRY